MKYEYFVNDFISLFEEDAICSLAHDLSIRALHFKYITGEMINRAILSEKLYDYIALLEAKTGKPFEKHVSTYFNSIESLASSKIVKFEQPGEGRSKNGKPTRAKKYYDKAKSYRTNSEPTVESLLDFSRIMLSLYSAALDASVPVSDFDYSKPLDTKRILEAMRNETVVHPIKHTTAPRFDLTEACSPDSLAFVIVIIVLAYFKENAI